MTRYTSHECVFRNTPLRLRFQQVESLSPPKAGNLIDMYEQKGHFVENKTILPAVSFIDRDSEIFFATPAQIFRRNRQMDNPIQNDAEITELKYEKSSGAIEGAEMNEGTSLPLKDPDTTLTLIVLLLACAALAVLAHVVV